MSGGKEAVDELRSDPAELFDFLGHEIRIERPERLLFVIVSPAECPLVVDEPSDIVSENAAKACPLGSHSASSPSPRATLRRVSIATLP
jgi:hypothetical protein